MDRPRYEGFLALANTGKTKEISRTEWDFELRREPNRLANLNYSIRCRIVHEALKMEDENKWKRFDLHFLALADLHWLGRRDVRECVSNGVYRIGLQDFES